jgi:hypothetical protein
MNALQGVHVLIFLLIATTLEVSGDAVVRKAIYDHVGPIRVGLFLVGAILLFGYGSVLNLAPVAFGRVVGLYIATLCVAVDYLHCLPNIADDADFGWRRIGDRWRSNHHVLATRTVRTAAGKLPRIDLAEFLAASRESHQCPTHRRSGPLIVLSD